MFDQSADASAHGQSPAPAGMRELTPQPPARPGAPTIPAPSLPNLYPGYDTSPLVAAAPVPEPDPDRPGPDDLVVARDDHLEGTFTSRGTIHVMGSVKGRIEALRLHVDAGAKVEADAVVDEAVIAGEFIGNLTCRQRLEARPSGRLSGVIETYRVMLHEGASFEGEVRMLPEPVAPGSRRSEAPAMSGAAAPAAPPTRSCPWPQRRPRRVRERRLRCHRSRSRSSCRPPRHRRNRPPHRRSFPRPNRRSPLPPPRRSASHPAARALRRTARAPIRAQGWASKT